MFNKNVVLSLTIFTLFMVLTSYIKTQTRMIEKKIALDVINKSSGRSLMTEERIPKHIMEKNYNYGFSLGLMNKDVQLALKLIKNPIMFSHISSLLKKSLEKYGNDADYTEVAKLFLENN